MSSERLAPLILLAGPSGAGKTTVVDRLLLTTKLPIRRAVTATSRAPRPNEINGVHYHFWTPEEFESKIAADEMLEFSVVYGHDYYGVPLEEAKGSRRSGTAVIIVIDVQGVEQIKRNADPESLITIFLMPPDLADLKERLRKRGQSEESIERRLQTAIKESSKASEFQHTLINADVDTAARELERIIESQFPQPRSATCSSN